MLKALVSRIYPEANLLLSAVSSGVWIVLRAEKQERYEKVLPGTIGRDDSYPVLGRDGV